MTEERVTERTDGVTTERVIERGGPTHTVVEKRGGGGVMVAVVLLIAVLIGGYFLLQQSNNDAVRTDAISDAAGAVEKGAQKVGDAAQKAVGE